MASSAAALGGCKIGFLGCGMMASAMIRGLIAGGVPPSAIMGCDLAQASLDALPAGCLGTLNAADVVTHADVVVVAVKPYTVSSILEGVSPAIQAKGPASTLVVSIAAGVTIATLEGSVPAGTRVVRCMPNTPCLVGEAAVAFARGKSSVGGDSALTSALFTGTVLEVAEKDLDAVTALSGSGPAYVFVFIEALADAGVRAGLTRPVALQLAAQTIKGAAAMQLETGAHPGVLKDQVCSPGGTTIAGVEALEKNGFRAAAMSAVAAAKARCEEMGKGK
eukprot:CAMPEP_0172643882 /NCGR_PEP_ID=MMETSP1068-20121228/238769_1 /TAXON_ID=35684 /ORGANISM="Pseudopedinella elastica, Strain CCMP716" /LENGTH=277 /DNA_ID=CAMNT_0013458037 /DNA_START=16 /DNA_END=849 /DNA_ORIENTATION=+